MQDMSITQVPATKFDFKGQLKSILVLTLQLPVKHSQSSPNFKFAMFLQYIKKKLEMKLISCMQINIKVSYKLISTLCASKFPTT